MRSCGWGLPEHQEEIRTQTRREVLVRTQGDDDQLQAEDKGHRRNWYLDFDVARSRLIHSPFIFLMEAYIQYLSLACQEAK